MTVLDVARERTMSHWTLHDGRVVALLTPAELTEVPDGTVLVSIMGRRAVVGTDTVDGDTRGGFLAFGPVIFDRTYEERMATLAEKVVEHVTDDLIRGLAREGEGPLVVALSHLRDCTR